MKHTRNDAFVNGNVAKKNQVTNPLYIGVTKVLYQG